MYKRMVIKGIGKLRFIVVVQDPLLFTANSRKSNQHTTARWLLIGSKYLEEIT